MPRVENFLMRVNRFKGRESLPISIHVDQPPPLSPLHKSAIMSTFSDLLSTSQTHAQSSFDQALDEMQHPTNLFLFRSLYGNLGYLAQFRKIYNTTEYMRGGAIGYRIARDHAGLFGAILFIPKVSNIQMGIAAFTTLPQGSDKRVLQSQEKRVQTLFAKETPLKEAWEIHKPKLTSVQARSIERGFVDATLFLQQFGEIKKPDFIVNGRLLTID